MEYLLFKYFIYFLLLLTSIISLGFIIERGRALRWGLVIPPELAEDVHHCRTPEALPLLLQTCKQFSASPLSRLIVLAMERLDWPKDENAEALQTRARHEVSLLERGLVVLEIVTGIAPLLGLVGTVFGLIILFAGMGDMDSQDSAKFAQGISLALWATFTGLMIAIPSIIAWSIYNNRVEMLAVEMETLCDTFLRQHYPNGKVKQQG